VKRHVGALAAVGLLVLVAAPASIADLPLLTVPSDMTVAATDASGAVVSFSYTVSDADDPTPAPTATCNPDTGSLFPLGDTTVNCSATSAGGTATRSFKVTVADETPPVLTVPGNQTATTSGSTAVVTYTEPTATDNVDSSPTVSCDHHTGDAFLLGQTTVTCTATDAAGLTDSKSFTVTVSFVDTTPPVLTVPSTQTREATGPAGAVVTYAPAPSATDNVDPSPIVACNPASGSSFVVGTTPVSCTATDAAGNRTTGSFDVNVVDTTPPNVTVSGVQTWTATSPSGATVTFTASATDLVDGSITPSCSPQSGDTLPLGAHTITCTATDAHGRTGTGTLHVTVVDSAPTIVGVPANVVAEANGPSGAVATYTPPSATDTVDGGLAVTCSPASGATFPLGATMVDCSATNSSSQTATASFGVTVGDTTPPTIPVPGSITLTASGDVPATDRNIVAFLALTAHDLVDPSPIVTNDAPAIFHQGTTVVTFESTDNAGNTSTASGVVEIVSPPAGGGAPAAPGPVAVISKPLDRTPPGNVSKLSVRMSGKSALLRWRLPVDGDFDHVAITRQRGSKAAAVLVYNGKGTTFTDRRLTTGISYRYLIVSYDSTGNRSTGVVALATAPPQLLYAPGQDARVSAPVILRWRATRGATFYNVQLYRNGKKVLSEFPGREKLIVPSAWKYGGKAHGLAKGRYDWFVWPGRGTRRKPHFAPMEGFNSFVVVRTG
jgi:hypothetical protein